MAVGALIFLVWWARGVAEKVKKVDKLPCENHDLKLDQLGDIKSKVENLPCCEHKEIIEKHSDKHNSVGETIVRVETTLKFMQTKLDDILHNSQPNKGGYPEPFTQSNSPISITEKGVYNRYYLSRNTSGRN